MNNRAAFSIRVEKNELAPCSQFLFQTQEQGTGKRNPGISHVYVRVMLPHVTSTVTCITVIC